MEILRKRETMKTWGIAQTFFKTAEDEVRTCQPRPGGRKKKEGARTGILSEGPVMGATKDRNLPETWFYRRGKGGNWTPYATIRKKTSSERGYSS